MLKKLIVTAATAAAVSVPLAGGAWAHPPSDLGSSNPGPANNDNGIGQGGVPKVAGGLLDSAGAPNPNGPGNPVPLGKVYSTIANEDGNVPDGVGVFVNNFYETYGGIPNPGFGPTPPGIATKTFTPGCSSGHTATLGGGSICN
jgi:hypothetical protein